MRKMGISYRTTEQEFWAQAQYEQTKLRPKNAELPPRDRPTRLDGQRQQEGDDLLETVETRDPVSAVSTK